MDNLFKIANEEFYLDLDKISELIRIEPTVDELLVYTQTSDETKEEVTENNPPTNNIIFGEPPQDMGGPQTMMDVAKWEVMRALIESVLNENGIIDESMGIKKLESQLSIPFRLSFNTLIKNKIIKKNG